MKNKKTQKVKNKISNSMKIHGIAALTPNPFTKKEQKMLGPWYW